MLIGQVSAITGLSKDTLRYYEKIGLIHLSSKQRSENNYRAYDQSVLNRIDLIKKTKSFGFTLNEIKNILALDEANLLACSSISTLVQDRLKKTEEKINELQSIRAKLLAARAACRGDCMETFKSF